MSALLYFDIQRFKIIFNSNTFLLQNCVIEIYLDRSDI